MGIVQALGIPCQTETIVPKNNWATVKVECDSVNVDVCTTRECNCGLSHFFPWWTCLYISRWKIRGISYGDWNDKGTPPTYAQYSRYFWIVKPSGIYSLIICANQRCLTKSFEVTVDCINGISLGNCGTLNPTSRCVWVSRSRLLMWTEYRWTSYSSCSAVNQVGWKWWPMKHNCPRPVLFLRIIQPFLCSFLYHTQW